MKSRTYKEMLTNCTLCPRNCGVNRLENKFSNSNSLCTSNNGSNKTS